MPRREPITRESILDPEGTHCDRMRAHWRARVAFVAELGVQGKIPLKKSESFRLGLKAAIRMLDRYDPVPRQPLVAAQFNGPVVVTWQSPPPISSDVSSSPTALARSNPSSTNGSPSNGHAPPSSSAIDDLGNL